MLKDESLKDESGMALGLAVIMVVLIRCTT